MKEMFLERYFGTDKKIKYMAYGLILANQMEAARTLNQLVDIMGGDVDSSLLMAAVNEKHREAFSFNEDIRNFSREQVVFQRSPSLATLGPLLMMAGYTYKEEYRGLFRGPRYAVMASSMPPLIFNSVEDFISWGLDEFK
jgi:hypothetical protein